MEISDFTYASVGEGATVTLFNNDSGSTDPELQIQSSTLERVLICNTDSEDITVDLAVTDGTDTFYILKSTSIPQNTTLDVLDGVPFIYDSRFRVYIVTGSGNICDVLASKK